MTLVFLAILTFCLPNDETVAFVSLKPLATWLEIVKEKKKKHKRYQSWVSLKASTKIQVEHS